MENNNSKENVKWTIVTIIAVVVVIGIVFFLPKGVVPSKYKNIDAFAQCLTNKGVIMYGAYWCAHCKAQKALFGDSFKYIHYVECTDDPKACADAGVQSYPTWKFASTTTSGEQTFEDLARDSGCTLELNTSSQ